MQFCTIKADPLDSHRVSLWHPDGLPWNCGASGFFPRGAAGIGRSCPIPIVPVYLDAASLTSWWHESMPKVTMIIGLKGSPCSTSNFTRTDALSQCPQKPHRIYSMAPHRIFKCGTFAIAGISCRTLMSLRAPLVSMFRRRRTPHFGM